MRDIGGRNAAGQVVARGVSLVRMRFDPAHPSLSRGGILRRQGMFGAFDHPLVMPLAHRDAKTAGPQSNVGERKSAVVERLKANVVGDALHVEIRLQTVHDAEMSAISFGLLGSAFYQPSCTNFSKLIFVADQEDPFALLQ